ncbi:MAG TPA: hypothetical protein VKE40_13005 [Gemmataceae bacterium]|nr:hypothetical protein [Gemmataceae bacterium]
MSEHDPRDDYDDAPWKGRVAPEHLIRWPASAMWVFGLVQLILSLLGLVLMTVGVVWRAQEEPDKWASHFLDEDLRVILAAGVFGTIANTVILYGAAGMGRFRRYPWAVSASVLIVFSMPFVYFAVFTVPLGIWALLVLCRRDVRARFAATARGTITGSPPEVSDARRTSPP